VNFVVVFGELRGLETVDYLRLSNVMKSIRTMSRGRDLLLLLLLLIDLMVEAEFSHTTECEGFRWKTSEWDGPGTANLRRERGQRRRFKKIKIKIEKETASKGRRQREAFDGKQSGEHEEEGGR
jgi:hypothetical protein